jgi:hypothetical protein
MTLIAKIYAGFARIISKKTFDVKLALLIECAGNRL